MELFNIEIFGQTIEEFDLKHKLLLVEAVFKDTNNSKQNNSEEEEIDDDKIVKNIEKSLLLTKEISTIDKIFRTVLLKQNVKTEFK